MHWLNEPTHWQARDDELLVTADPRTDFWRTTHYGFIRDNGHFYHQEATGDFQLDVVVRGRYAAPRDQAGLMPQIDARNWLKFGVEFVRGQLQVSAVATREVSDESLLPLPDGPPTVWLRLWRRNEGVELFFSRDGAAYARVRIAYFPPVASVRVGLMAAAPEGANFQARFTGWRWRAV